MKQIANLTPFNIFSEFVELFGMSLGEGEISVCLFVCFGGGGGGETPHGSPIPVRNTEEHLNIFINLVSFLII